MLNNRLGSLGNVACVHFFSCVPLASLSGSARVQQVLKDDYSVLNVKYALNCLKFRGMRLTSGKCDMSLEALCGVECYNLILKRLVIYW